MEISTCPEDNKPTTHRLIENDADDMPDLSAVLLRRLRNWCHVHAYLDRRILSSLPFPLEVPVDHDALQVYAAPHKQMLSCALWQQAK